eukprot:12229481-Alexandrium_andersonii.AAC.1
MWRWEKGALRGQHRHAGGRRITAPGLAPLTDHQEEQRGQAARDLADGAAPCIGLGAVGSPHRLHAWPLR